MELYVGGVGQGKISYVRQKYGVLEEEIWDGRKENEMSPEGKRVAAHLEAWFREQMKREGEKPEEIIHKWMKLYPDLIFICDEVGNGIVPLDPFEREYRDRLGRILCEIAGESVHMERVICGIGQRIK